MKPTTLLAILDRMAGIVTQCRIEMSNTTLRSIDARRRISNCVCLATAAICLSCCIAVGAQAAEPEAPRRPKRVIGATSIVDETDSEIRFVARVDTGATTCSMHVEEFEIQSPAATMDGNVGKKIRFRIKNRRGKSDWLERKIVEVATIKTSEREERRYKVSITLLCDGVKKRVLVSLNDRSHMTYSVLLGRNFLEGDFLVDVSLEN